MLTGADNVITFFQVLIALGSVALLLGLGVVVRDLVATQRPRRLARRESIPAYYLSGHAFAH
ncbi:hypothetical protein BN10_630027 [Phycicoccus elongatus Lp2]|uniref:Uncharacterized protein n=1 Tax=Phycicoccus elongatus Lp2 TaxID=1193181 RepID=N0E159_9MICO|nr:hypothetical protein [Phycicoccus elongatus]CCH70673.1 hypothetical protein BN10_630027 [Phycicoccus elongatus Lp2]